jgi:hypothetical protein
VRGKRIVEPAHAGKPAGDGDLVHRQVGIGQQLLGRQQPARLQVLDRRHAELGLEDAAQVALADADARGQARHRRIIGQPGVRIVHQPRRLLRQDRRRILDRPPRRARRQFRAAAQARPETGRLGQRRMGEETAVLAPWRAHAAYRPAVDAGGRHAGEEAAVETCVTGLEGAVACVRIDGCGGLDHAAMVRRCGAKAGCFRT